MGEQASHKVIATMRDGTKQEYFIDASADCDSVAEAIEMTKQTMLPQELANVKGWEVEEDFL